MRKAPPSQTEDRSAPSASLETNLSGRVVHRANSGLGAAGDARVSHLRRSQGEAKRKAKSEKPHPHTPRMGHPKKQVGLTPTRLKTTSCA